MIIDSHIHFSLRNKYTSVLEALDLTNASYGNLVAQIDKKRSSETVDCLYAKYICIIITIVITKRAFLLFLKEKGIHPAIAIIHKVVSDLDIKGTEKKILTNTVAQTKHLVNIVFSSSLLLKHTTERVIIVWGRRAFIDALLVS